MVAFDGRVNIVADALTDQFNQFSAIGDMEENFQVSYGWGWSWRRWSFPDASTTA